MNKESNMQHLYTKASTLAIALVVGIGVGTSGAGTVLWNNGAFHGGDPADLGLITHHGVGPGGAHSSVASTSFPTLGTVFTRLGDGPHFRHADDFAVRAEGWRVNAVTVYGYIDDGDPNGNPFEGGTFDLNIRNSDGGSPGSIVGSTSNFETPEFTNIYRQNTGEFPDGSRRPIFGITLTFDEALTLSEGNYWFDVQYQSEIFNPGFEDRGWMPVLTQIDEDGVTFPPLGNSQRLNSNGTWSSPTTGGQTYDVPFLIHGSVIPAPAGLAVLGLSGIAFTRRRCSM